MQKLLLRNKKALAKTTNCTGKITWRILVSNVQVINSVMPQYLGDKWWHLDTSTGLHNFFFRFIYFSHNKFLKCTPALFSGSKNVCFSQTRSRSYFSWNSNEMFRISVINGIVARIYENHLITDNFWLQGNYF